MSALTKRVVIFTVGLTTLGAVSASAMPRHAVVVAPRVVVQRPFLYDPFWGPWGPYTYGYPYPYSVYPQASIRTEVTPKDAEVYVDGYYAGIVDDFDGTFQRLTIEAGPHHIELTAQGAEPRFFDVYVDPSRPVDIHADLFR